LHQVGELFESNVKVRCQKVNTGRVDSILLQAVRDEVWQRIFFSFDEFTRRDYNGNTHSSFFRRLFQPVYIFLRLFRLKVLKTRPQLKVALIFKQNLSTTFSSCKIGEGDPRFSRRFS
jgi:hypothetical protein